MSWIWPRNSIRNHLTYPIIFRFAPLTDGEDSRTLLSPKVGFVWELAPRTFLRGAYTRSLDRVSFEQSFRLEPTEVAGFNQAFRSLIPESSAGPSAAQEFETLQAALETRLSTSTWLSVSAQRLTSDGDR